MPFGGFKHNMSGGANYLPKFLPISFFQARISFYRCFGTFGPPIRKLSMYTGMLPCLVPSWPQSMQLRISFRSRSDLVLDADHALDFLSYLVFQACMSFYSVLDKSGAWMFLPCSIKNAVARMICIPLGGFKPMICIPQKTCRKISSCFFWKIGFKHMICVHFGGLSLPSYKYFMRN